MSVLRYLTNTASRAILSQAEKASIDRSIAAIQTRLDAYFQSDMSRHFRFGSSTRGTILPRKLDENSDIDYMVVFNDNSYTPQTYLNWLRQFVMYYYQRSEIFQSSPTIVLNLNHIKFELVPATTHWWSGFRIPAPASDYRDWMSTDPRGFNELLTRTNNSHASLIKPSIRLLKYWNAYNGGIFISYSLEEYVVNKTYWRCSNLKDYFFSAVEGLNFQNGVAQWRHNKLTRAKQIVANTKYYEEQGMSSLAELEIKKLIPEF